MAKIFRPEQVSLKEHLEITEKIIQDKIAEDPAILGLGELILKDKERMQPKAGRLDLLLQDPETYRRYEVEIQLGKTDETHIIRTIEYWDIERKRYPQYDHCAVIIAEDITSRFLNVISLFNGFIPLIAIQIKAFKFGDDIGLVFTKVLDEMPLGLVEEDEEKETPSTVATKEYWIKRSSLETMQIADKLLEVINDITSHKYYYKYTKANVRFMENGQLISFALIRINKQAHVVLVLKIPKSDEIDLIIEKNGFDDMGYNLRLSRYRIKITEEDISAKKSAIKELFVAAEDNYNS